MAERKKDRLVHSPSLNLEAEHFSECMGTNVSAEIILEINCDTWLLPHFSILDIILHSIYNEHAEKQEKQRSNLHFDTEAIDVINNT